MARSWLVLPGPSRAHAARLAGLSQSVDVAALDLPIALPVAVDAYGALHWAARGIDAARIIDETPLIAASVNRIAATRVVVDGDVIVVYGGRSPLRLKKTDVDGAFAVRLYSGPAIVLSRGDAGHVVIARDTDLSTLFPGTTPDEAFTRFAAGVAGLVGRPVDATLLDPGVASVLRLVDDVVDILDLGRLAKDAPALPPPPEPPPAATTTPLPHVLGAAGLAAAATTASCASCGATVVAADAWSVAGQPTCAVCVRKYTDGHRERRAIFSGALFLAVAALFFLNSSFDVVGRLIGAGFLLLVVHTILSTGAQYDVDVDRGIGRQRTRVRSSGFFRLWGDIGALKWGRGIQGALFAMLAVGLWLVPLHKGITSGDFDDGSYVDDDTGYTAITLVPLAGSAQHGGLRLELVEIRKVGGLTFIVEASRGGAELKLYLTPKDIGRRQTHFGVSWQILAFSAAPTSLTITFDNVRLE